MKKSAALLLALVLSVHAGHALAQEPAPKEQDALQAAIRRYLQCQMDSIMNYNDQIRLDAMERAALQSEIQRLVKENEALKKGEK